MLVKKLFYSIYKLCRQKFWELLIKKKSFHKFYISTKTGSILLSTFGDIPRVLYKLEFLNKQKKSFEYKTISLFEKLVETSSVIFDIGANVGLLSVIASRTNKKATIHSFEPSSKTYQVLNYNIELNKCPNILVNQMALSNAQGEVVLYTPESEFKDFDDSFKTISIDKAIDTNQSKSAEKVRMSTFDTYVFENQIRDVSLIKIDIEGAELLFFRGAAKYFTDNKNNLPILVFENTENNNQRFNYTVTDTLAYLSKFGFRIYNYDYEQWVAYPLEKEEMVKKILNEI